MRSSEESETPDCPAQVLHTPRNDWCSRASFPARRRSSARGRSMAAAGGRRVAFDQVYEPEERALMRVAAQPRSTSNACAAPSSSRARAPRAPSHPPPWTALARHLHRHPMPRLDVEEASKPRSKPQWGETHTFALTARVSYPAERSTSGSIRCLSASSRGRALWGVSRRPGQAGAAREAPGEHRASQPGRDRRGGGIRVAKRGAPPQVRHPGGAPGEAQGGLERSARSVSAPRPGRRVPFAGPRPACRRPR